MVVNILVSDFPRRSIALVTPESALIFGNPHDGRTSSTSLSLDIAGGGGTGARCIVEFADVNELNREDYTPLTSLPCLGCLGLISLEGNTFLCVITQDRQVANPRPGETVSRIHGVEFHCINRSNFDHYLESEINQYPVESDGWDQGRSQQPVGVEHPCLALRKLLSGGTFYYSGDFDLTNRLQDRSVNSNSSGIDVFDTSFLWNSHMIEPLLQFRSRLSPSDRSRLDSSGLLTCAIRGFVESLTIPRPATRMEGRMRGAEMPAILTLISRLSCRRAGTRFNSRGIDDDGNVANFVETETVMWYPSSDNERAVCFSYCQVRGSVPIFWEQQTGLLPNQQKIQITRSTEATQPAFDKHMEGLVLKYGAAHILNLLSETKSGEVELSTHYRRHIQKSSLTDGGSREARRKASLLRCTEYDFHAETKGPAGYEAASQIKHLVQESANAFGYFLVDTAVEYPKELSTEEDYLSTTTSLQQEGVFRTNCLDCLDRTNLIQGILSRMAIEDFLINGMVDVSHNFWMNHSTLWADNGDALSKIYAGTGALKSSFTRTGKTSLAGAIADARKSVTRMYINNFADKDRQNTIDILLGRIVGQEPVHLYDPLHDYVTAQLFRRSSEFTSEKPIHILVGTFNLNGRLSGIDDDLSEWLAPSFLGKAERQPELVVVGFQEIVELSPQQIMSTDPARRKLWEKAVLRNLNRASESRDGDKYVLLRGGQLVGAALLIFVKTSAIGVIKNVEGSLKKTGLSGVAGNKGAVAIRMEYSNTRLCFVTAHLAAGFSNYEERNRDYNTISDGLRFQRGRTIDDHDTVIWLGDFNYRIGLMDEKVRKLIKIGDYETLYDNDQLNIQMIAGLTFPYYTETRPMFPPTYKFDAGTDRYDSSEKSRAPAWCDRILWKGSNLRQLSYNSAPLLFSDHRPVYATFQCTVAIINEVLKQKIERELYLSRKGDATVSTATASTSDEEDDLLDCEPIAPGLPRPSSNKQKWWLNNGTPAKSELTSPRAGMVLNPQRPDNPFTETTESDWVALREKSLSRQPSELSNTSNRGPLRKLPPPYNPTELPPLPARGPTSIAPTRKPAPSVDKAKPPPTVPKKPPLLSQTTPQTKRDVPTLPPRRATTFDNSSRGGMLIDASAEDEKPPLPPRRSGTERFGVLDDDDEGIDQMSAWKPLQPS